MPLQEHVAGLSTKPTAAALLTEILATEADVQGLKWSMNEAYGAALGALARDSVKDQVSTLYAVQKYCHANKFPKIGAKKTSLIQMMFQVLYKYEIISEEGFAAWRDDEEEDLPGRVDAVVQTTPFMLIIFAEDEEEEGEEEDDRDEIDAPMESI